MEVHSSCAFVRYGRTPVFSIAARFAQAKETKRWHVLAAVRCQDTMDAVMDMIIIQAGDIGHAVQMS